MRFLPTRTEFMTILMAIVGLGLVNRVPALRDTIANKGSQRLF